MPVTDALTLERNKTNYINQDRSVNIREYVDRQEKLEKSGLEGIEIVDKAKSLGKDDFLKLLVTQLSHQDPTQPVQDQQFIAQMAQFSSLEQMQNISTSVVQMSDRQAFGLVGKFIMGVDSETGQIQNGIAEAIIYDESNKPFVRVNGKAIAVKDVKVIGDANLLTRSPGVNPSANTAEPESNAADPAKNTQLKTEELKNIEIGAEKKSDESSQNDMNKEKNSEKKDTAQEPVSYYDDFNYSRGKISVSI